MLVEFHEITFTSPPLVADDNDSRAITREFFKRGDGATNSLDTRDAPFSVNRNIDPRPHEDCLATKGLGAKPLLVLGVILNGRYVS